MSNVKLTLRPPPNVDFVHGYPGIPPGPDRQQAAVKGAIEVRTPPSGVKAQWVRIELRKVETLPGGGDTNKFYDYVGPSPVTLWTAPDEYNILRTQDFPFSIRIPESIPPTIALESRAGIEYELVATVCTKGKKTFLRKRKNIVSKEISPVIIDKHELHSTWPVYCQPEKRQLTQDGVTLIVERNHTCYGPGDRISVIATLKSDNLHTVLLRGFELTLKESIIFRAHTYGTNRKQAPMVKVGNIGENKVAINANLYGGTMHQAELVCQLPPNHTTTTINAARHIDVTYVLSVKALMSTGTHITMDLPVIISNWQRYVSQEAIRRIGPAPALSLVPPSTAAAPVMSIEPTSPRLQQQPPAINTMPSAAQVRSPTNQFSSLPASNVSGRPGTAGSAHVPDEFGYGAGYAKPPAVRPTIDTKPKEDEASIITRPSIGGGSIATQQSSVPTARRPNSARAANAANRFTITNAEPEIPEENSSVGHLGNPARNVGMTPSHQQQQQQPKPWLTAEEEKRAYEAARSRVERVQGVTAAPASAPTAPAPAPTHSTTSSGSKQPWLSPAEEKALLYEKAQAGVAKSRQNIPGEGPPATTALSSGSSGSTTNHNNNNSKLTPAQLYQQAMANVNANQNRNQPAPPHVSPLSGRSTNTSSSSPAPAKIPHFLTAEQEKEAFKRYEEAKMAVERVHNPDVGGSAPIAYDSLYPKRGGGSSSSNPTAGAGAGADIPPPSFEAAVTPITAGAGVAHLSAAAEKAALAERMRTMDAQGASEQDESPPPAFNSPTTPTAAVPNTREQYQAAAVEKEAVRLRLEAKDAAAAAKKQRKAQARQQAAAAAAAAASTPQTPQRNGIADSRPVPTPPTNAGSGSRILTAAEEKALLQAKYDAKDARKMNGTPRLANATTPPPSSSTPQPRQQSSVFPPSTPPPLMPRPPAEYIQETQEEDARVSRLALSGSSNLRLGDGGEEYGVNGGSGSGGSSGSLYGNMNVVEAPGAPPPLPPKPAGE